MTNVADAGDTIDSQTFAITLATNFIHGGTAATDGGLEIALSTATPGAVTLSDVLGQTGGPTINSAAPLLDNNTYSGATAINAFVDMKTSGNIFGATGTGNGMTINTHGTVRFRDTTGATISEAFTLNGGTFLTYNSGSITTFSGLLTLNTGTTISVSPQSASTLNTTLALAGGIAESSTSTPWSADTRCPRR